MQFMLERKIMGKCSKMKSCTRRKSTECHISYKTCNKITTNNRSKQCNKCRNTICIGHEIGRSDDDGDNEINRTSNPIEQSGETNDEMNRRRLDLKHQNYTESKKNEICALCLALSARGFGPDQRENIMMVKSAIKECETHALLLSSPDRR